jgi:AcrR family transcriptional regulator
MARPRQALLSRQRIIDTAAALIDAEGLASFSTRRLASELGVQGPSLYHHFSNKEEILDTVADLIASRVDVSFFGKHDWRVALRLWGHSYRDALASHPNIAPVLVQDPSRRPAELIMADAVVRGLVEAGWPPARATHVGATMHYFVAGSALHQRGVDERSFTLGLDALIDGLARVYERVVGPLPPLPQETLEPLDAL